MSSPRVSVSLLDHCVIERPLFKAQNTVACYKILPAILAKNDDKPATSKVTLVDRH